MSILHVYDNKGLFNNHPHGYSRQFYHTVYDEKEDCDEVVFKPTVSGWDMKGKWVTGTPITVVPGEFIIIRSSFDSH